MRRKIYWGVVILSTLVLEMILFSGFVALADFSTGDFLTKVALVPLVLFLAVALWLSERFVDDPIPANTVATNPGAYRPPRRGNA